jgi:hypothetical protein
MCCQLLFDLLLGFVVPKFDLGGNMLAELVQILAHAGDVIMQREPTICFF